jgi:lipopolysaccharide/colanic/teichoic acid biosynthesis glycosyltransferase
VYQTVVKYSLDTLIAITVFIIISPVFILILFFLSLANNGKPFFFQKRPGKNEKIFTIIKFKTMNDKKDTAGVLLPDGDRLTRVGALVRASSLDEIPQLLNVVSGKMSFVGPRPLLPHYLPLYDDSQKKRHSVKPGITGWAQVMGRNAISWDRKFELDLWYINNQSFLLDLKILLITFKKVLFKENINKEGLATTEPFTGNK